MKKLSFHFLFLILFVFPANTSFAQVVFEPGYFIDNEDVKTSCLIKNYEWNKSPTRIEFKISEDSKSEIADISQVKEFSVSNLKYQRHSVKIDKSSVVIDNLSEVKEPLFADETLFLKVVIEGKATLFSGGAPLRYFCQVNDSAVEQLIYKEYLTEDFEIAVNNGYKSQLWNMLKCSCLTVDDFRNLYFSKKGLIKKFEEYNQCVGSEFVNYDKSSNNGKINLRLKPGYRYSTLSVSNSSNQSQNIEFGGDNTFCVGLEAEFVFPFNKAKWALTTEATYQYYYAEDPRANYSNTVDYKSIEFPIGIKYNMFLNNKSVLFLSTAFVIWDEPINSSFGRVMDINTRNNLNLGIGYNYNNKYSVEFRYGTKRELLNNYVFYSSNYQSFSIFLGYNIF